MSLLYYVQGVIALVQMSFLSVKHASIYYAMIAWQNNLEANGYGLWVRYPMMNQITVVIPSSALIVIIIWKLKSLIEKFDRLCRKVSEFGMNALKVACQKLNS